MTTCNAVKEELVAYRDGELSEQDREQIAAHLQTCAECAREEAQLAQVEQLFSQMERITPSPDFAATFWKRLEQEQVHMVESTKPPVRESRLAQWWKGFRETFMSWQIAPMLAATASILVLFSYLLISPRTPTQGTTPQTAPSQVATTKAPTPAPTGLTEHLNFFLQYPIIADLNRLSHLEDIAAVDLSKERETEVAKEEELPPELLKNPSFFAHYPLLKKMDQLQNLEAVLDTPTKENEHDQG